MRLDFESSGDSEGTFAFSFQLLDSEGEVLFAADTGSAKDAGPVVSSNYTTHS